MRAYVCVYRNSVPTRRSWALTERAAAGDPALAKFLTAYERSDCYYDWGDDPSFFAASEILGDPRKASWGVCRRDVRSSLQPGDFVAWFCAKQRSEPKEWRYFFVGCGTAAHVISRNALWEDSRFAPYRRFYNVLAKPRR